ncbi:MAG: orotate phosphoribosyltransferase [Acidimicrobiales bacterium]|nr:orotate phosphoribosyltransferase [Acidimicrobiales bacterium]
MDPALGIARLLLDTPGGITVTDGELFEFASGLRSPLYVDCRTLVSRLPTRRAVVGHLAEVAEGFEGVDAVVGVATGGIPWGAWLSDSLERPFAYVRPAAKERGTKQAVEGSIEPGSSLLVIEDLVTTGGSSLRCVDSLTDAGYAPVAVLSIFSYDLACATELFADKGVRLASVCTMPDLLGPASEHPGYAAKVDLLRTWHRDEASAFRPG